MDHSFVRCSEWRARRTSRWLPASCARAKRRARAAAAVAAGANTLPYVLDDFFPYLLTSFLPYILAVAVGDIVDLLLSTL